MDRASTSNQAARLKALTNPDTVAIVGASDNIAKLQARPMRFMQQHGFSGRIYPVNPGRQSVLGCPAWSSIEQINERIDHAYLLLDTESAIQAFEQCVQRQVAVVTILADGFAEAGDAGRLRQAQLQSMAQDSDTLLLGPNSTGIVDVPTGFSCTTNAAFAAPELIAGKTAVISQSGSLIGTIYSRGAARGIGYSTLVSTGNEAIADVAQIGRLLVEDDRTDAFILFLETIRDPDGLKVFAQRAYELDKPVIAYMIGQSAEGQALSVSHTGALTGSARAADSYLQALGIRRASNFESLFEAPDLLRRFNRLSDRPRSVTVVSTTGGGGAMVIDQLAAQGVEIAGISPTSRATLTAQNIPLGHGKLVDVTLAGARYESMRAVADTLIHDPDTGVLLVAIGSSAQFNPELAVRPLVDAVREARAGAAPLLALPLPEARDSLRQLAAAGIPAFGSVDSCVQSVLLALHASGRPVDAPASSINQGLTAQIDAFLAKENCTVDTRSITLNETESTQILRNTGIEFAQSVELSNWPDNNFSEPPDISPLDYPVAVKLVSRGMPHKSEFGAVQLNISNPSQLQRACQGMVRTAQQARIIPSPAIVVQAMQTGIVAMILGLTRDPLTGPTIMVGIGGVTAELYADTALHPAPVSAQTAKKMIDQLKGAPLLRGYRGQELADEAALIDAIVKFSQLAGDQRILEAEINPLLVGPVGTGAIGVDALISLRLTSDR